LVALLQEFRFGYVGGGVLSGGGPIMVGVKKMGIIFDHDDELKRI
jgi:hypothetical protein